MSIEATINNLEDEIKALKDASEQSALQLPLYTYTIYFKTTPNSVTVTQSGYQPITFDAPGRTVVTFDSAMGANALAFLEIQYLSGGYGESGTKFRRVPYSGGAQWVVYDEGYEREYEFTVHSAVPGTLGAKMIWQ